MTKEIHVLRANGIEQYLYKTNREGIMRPIINMSANPDINLSAGAVGPHAG